MREPHRSPVQLLVLHGLRCTGFATTQRLGEVVGGLGDFDVEEQLLALAAKGWVRHHPGEFGGWELTEAGGMADAEQVAAELEQTGRRDELVAAYGDFLGLNQRVLDLCGMWQLRAVGASTVLNDHSDRAYDHRVLDQFAVLDAEAQPLCSRLGAYLHRFSRYGPRLATALARARRGDTTHLADSLDSYHAVWFQLHEDLLVTLGISRRS